MGIGIKRFGLSKSEVELAFLKRCSGRLLASEEKNGRVDWITRCRKWVEFCGELADDRLISEREFRTWNYPRFCLRRGGKGVRE